VRDAAAAPVLAGLEQDPSYTEISLTHGLFDGVDALCWSCGENEGDGDALR
jgi:hypothetical protein